MPPPGSDTPALVYNVENKVEHQELLEHTDGSQAICRIVDTGNIPVALGTFRKRQGMAKAGADEVNGFLEDAARDGATIEDSRAVDVKYWHRIVRETSVC